LKLDTENKYSGYITIRRGRIVVVRILLFQLARKARTNRGVSNGFLIALRNKAVETA